MDNCSLIIMMLFFYFSKIFLIKYFLNNDGVFVRYVICVFKKYFLYLNKEGKKVKGWELFW